MKAIAPRADAVLVVGAPNSSNSRAPRRSRANGRLHQCDAGADARDDIPWDGSPGSRTLGLTAGASAPEHLVQELIDRLPRALMT